MVLSNCSYWVIDTEKDKEGDREREREIHVMCLHRRARVPQQYMFCPVVHCGVHCGVMLCLITEGRTTATIKVQRHARRITARFLLFPVLHPHFSERFLSGH